MFSTTLNTPPFACNLSSSTFCYCPSLPTQMHDMGHEDEEKDDDNNNNDDDNDGDDDDDKVVIMFLNKTQLHVSILE